MSVFFQFFRGITTSESDCECHGHTRMMEATLPDETPVSVVQSWQGFHVVVGGAVPIPDAISGDEVMPEIFRQWLGVGNE